MSSRSDRKAACTKCQLESNGHEVMTSMIEKLFGRRVMVEFTQPSMGEKCVGTLRQAQGKRSAKVLTDSGDVVLFYIANVKSFEVLDEGDKLATLEACCASADTAAEMQRSSVPTHSQMQWHRVDSDQVNSRFNPNRTHHNKAPQIPPEDFDFIQSIPLYDFRTLSTSKSKSLGRILVLGIGGGCDVFAAYALSKHIAQLYDKATVLYGNTKSFGKKARLRMTNNMVCLWSSPKDLVPITADVHGTCALELSCPRGPEGSPLVFGLPSRSKCLSEQTAENMDVVIPALESLKLDLVIGVDCGGDSISGGVDWQTNPEAGRDMQMLQCLKASGIPLLHFVLGPGCDGETEESAMRVSCARLSAEGSLRGVVSLEPFLADMRACCKALAQTRTPNLMWRAQYGDLPKVEPPHGKDGDYVCITRGRRNTRVPREWLTIGLVMDYRNTTASMQSDSGRRKCEW
mmetsp:Transcript_78210/g.138502  ORF Transcript_78210/g.138502 Transcript_78210/m.138502 type:complete len:459 (-) Transcript_78210:154-1530(-)